MAQDEPYPSDLKEQEWNIISKLLPAGGKLGRPRALRKARHPQCDPLSGSPRLHLAGVAARFSTLPHSLLLFRQVAARGSVGAHQSCVEGSGEGCQRKKKAPSAAIIDSQSVKVAEQPGERGYDAGKKINGRKRHLLVDTLGLILAVVVHSAGVQDREGAKLLLPALLNFGWVRITFADAPGRAR